VYLPVTNSYGVITISGLNSSLCMAAAAAAALTLLPRSGQFPWDLDQ